MPENKVQITLEAINQTKGALDQAKSQVESFTNSIKKNWMQFTAAGLVIQNFMKAALEAEDIEARMAFQIGHAAHHFEIAKPYVDQFAESIMRTTRFSDEMAREGLGQMMQYTKELSKAMDGTRIAMDMSRQTGMDLGSTVRYIGMAMNGEVEILGRWILELRDLDDKLGKSATKAEKTAYAINILNQKFGGAAQKDMETYGGKLTRMINQFDEFKEKVAGLLLPVLSKSLEGWNLILDAITGKGIFEPYEKMIDRMKAANKAALETEKQDRVNAINEQNQIAMKAMIERQNASIAVEEEFTLKTAQLHGEEFKIMEAQRREDLKKAAAVKADQYKIIRYYEDLHLKLIQQRQEKEFEAMQSLASMWQGYYNERIARENEIIGLIKGAGVETTIGARFEFAGVEEEFRKISQKASMFTSEEFEKMKAIYVEKLKGILPAAGGEWEEISIPIGKTAARSGFGFATEYGAEWRFKEGMMTEEQRRIEAMREESIRRIEAMSKGIEFGRPSEILTAFDQTRTKALELEQTIQRIKDQKLQIDTSRLIDAMRDIDQVEAKLINLIQGDYKIKVGIDIVGEELIGRIEERLQSRLINKRSSLGPLILNE